MRKIGILFVALMFAACTAIAQNGSSSAASGSTSGNDTTSQQTTQQHKNTAVRDQNAAENAKDEGNKDMARLDQAAAIINQLLAAPDNGIPQDVMDNAKCVAVIPSMIKGGFIFGAEHGRGVATCRLPNGGWSAPAFFTATGGSWGAQIGVEGTDLVMLIMNQNGMNQLLDSKFKVGGSVSAAAGPVGREASASTNWKFRSEVLTYSRARGAFIGATLNGVAIHQDKDATINYYGSDKGFRPTLTGEVKDPHGNDRFVAAVRNAHAQATAKKEDNK